MTSSCYCITLRKATRRITAAYDAALEGFDINVAQFSLLRTVKRNPGLSLSDLAERMELDRSTVGRNIKVLERKALLETSPGKDQREAVLSLTSSGEILLEKAVPKWLVVQSDIEHRLGAHGVQQLNALLKCL